MKPKTLQTTGGMSGLRSQDLHIERLVWPFLVEFADEVVKAGLLLEGIHARRSCRLLLQGPVHSLVATVLLRVARPDALDGDPQS